MNDPRDSATFRALRFAVGIAITVEVAELTLAKIARWKVKTRYGTESAIANSKSNVYLRSA